MDGLMKTLLNWQKIFNECRHLALHGSDWRGRFLLLLGH